MRLADSLIAELEQEAATTRRVLERVPDGRLSWRPHARSMSLGQLAGHLATMISWGTATLDHPDFDVAAPFTAPPLTTRADLLANFDQVVAATRASLAAKSDAELMTSWTLKRGGHTIFTMPKAAVLRSFVLNHMIHHRGQLSVYLRLHDVPIPSIYGPSADEGSL